MGSLLPIIHVYLPETFSDRLSSYFGDNSGREQCSVLGQWNIKGVENGHKRTHSEPICQVPEGYRRVTRKSSQMSAYLESPRKKKAPVIALSIVGVAAHQEDRGELEILGQISAGGTKGYSSLQSNCPLQLCLNWNAETESLTVSNIFWNGQQFNPTRNHILLLYYNPEELQQWKVPGSYPLGLPGCLLSSIKLIRTKKFPQETSFYPAFKQAPLDYQDLQECYEIPPSSKASTNPLLKFLSQHSSGARQIIHKLTILFGVILKRYYLLPVINFLLLLLLDSLLGYLLSRYLVQFPDMVGLLHTSVEQMLAQLNHLLKWLRGAPAGLKLNPNLNSLYWRFFSYHIHLWANYIGILEPIFAIILHTIQYLGVLGLSIQISLVKDLLSLATFHVYCLYIYATRLYSLQATALKALTRVFFGRKYNPLRDRIDSVTLTTPELFLSSFGFVILIFLLPTTMVYYTGFVILRVPVLLVERVLRVIVVLYNKLPLVSWLLVYFKSPRVADEIYLKRMDAADFEITSFKICLQSTRVLFHWPNVSKGFRSMISGIIDGIVLKD